MSDTGTIAIIYNRRAGRHRADAMARQLAAKLAALGRSYLIYGDEWPRDLSHVSAAWIIGGDGTLNYFINHVVGRIPPMAIFKGGTGNDFANLLYGDADLDTVAERALQATPRAVDGGICNGLLFVNIVGIGFEGEALKDMNAIRWLGAFWGYYLAVLKAIFTFREPEYQLRIDGEAGTSSALLLLMVSNAPETGGGFKVSPLAKVDDGMLNLVTASRLGVIQRLLALPKVRKGQHLSLPVVRHRTVRKISVMADREVPGQLDGEMIHGRSFEIEVLPARFQFLY